ncbi:MAG: helix-turn-helix domain-containing protein [Acidimicrobiales bacterium]
MTSGDGTSSLAAEFLVEPFTEGSPGGHVQAAVEAFTKQGLSVELGPFASVAAGTPDDIADAVANMIRNSMAAGATSIRIHVGADAEKLSVGPLHDALASMIRAAERDIGSSSVEWNRAEKQQVVRMLDEQGAFLLRGAVDDMARIMGVSRITIYNYLNAIDRS